MQQRLRAPHQWGGRLLVCAACAALITPAGIAVAADTTDATATYAAPQEYASPINDRFYLEVIYFHADVHTLLRVDPSGIPEGGTTLSGEQDLGWPQTNSTGRLELMFRLRERNRIRVDYLQLNRSGDVTLDRTIIFGNETFQCTTTPCDFQSHLDWRMMGFTYTYAFVQNDRFELGAGVAVHLIQADLQGQAPALVESHETSVAGGLPTLAMDGIWNISRRFAFTARAQYIGGSLNGFTPSFQEYHGDFQYRWRKNLAFGVGYEYERAKFESVGHSNPGLLQLNISGPEAFLRVSF